MMASLGCQFYYIQNQLKSKLLSIPMRCFSGLDYFRKIRQNLVHTFWQQPTPPKKSHERRKLLLIACLLLHIFGMLIYPIVEVFLH